MNHIYRDYPTLGVTICVNCTQYKHVIEEQAHYIFEHGYCDPRYCPRCKAEECVPVGVECILSE